MKRTIVSWIQLSEQVASPRMTLLSSALARYRLGNQIRIMKTSAAEETIRDEVDESGESRRARAEIDVASVAIARTSRRIPMPSVPHFSILDKYFCQ